MFIKGQCQAMPSFREMSPRRPSAAPPAPEAVGNVALRGGAVVQARAGLGRCAPRPTSTAGGTKSRGWSVGDRGRAAAMGVCASKPGAEPKPEAAAPLGSGVNESVPPRSAAAREQLWPTAAGGGTPSPTASSR